MTDFHVGQYVRIWKHQSYGDVDYPVYGVIDSIGEDGRTRWELCADPDCGVCPNLEVWLCGRHGEEIPCQVKDLEAC